LIESLVRATIRTSSSASDTLTCRTGITRPGTTQGIGRLRGAAKKKSTLRWCSWRSRCPREVIKTASQCRRLRRRWLAAKGFRKFDVQSALEGELPTSSVPTISRTIQWNTVVQYKVGKYLWPELEVNASYFHGGANCGKNQVFMTPGLIRSKITLRKDPKDRPGAGF